MGGGLRDPMIGWLQGQLADRWQQQARYGLLLVCGGVGYEVQIDRRHRERLPADGEILTLHVHQVVRDDSWSLYGFTTRRERDLFRDLVAVSGVGPQMALGLIGSLEPVELVQAIVQADLRLLCRAPGVGKRTAERLAVELRSRLQERYGDIATPGNSNGPGAGDPAMALTALPPAPVHQELRLTLAALGYEELEISRALRAVSSGKAPSAEDTEAWLRASLRWLADDQAA
jgi:holliday junction DNA helicase RuvA